MQSDGLQHIGSENARWRKTIEDAVINVKSNDNPDTELLKFLIDTRFPLFYKGNYPVFYDYVIRGRECATVHRFIIAMLTEFDSCKIVLVTPNSQAMAEIILWKIKAKTGFGTNSPIKLDCRNQVGSEVTLLRDRTRRTLVVIPPYNCNIQLVKGADFIICYDAFKACSDDFIGMASSYAPCIFVTQKSSLSDRHQYQYEKWVEGGWIEDYGYYKWLRSVVYSNIDLPREILMHIAGFAFGEEGI